MFSSCPRCDAVLSPIEGATPAFCPHCGLQQLRVSSDAVPGALASEQADSLEAGSPTDDTLNLARALRIVAIAGVCGILPGALLPGALVSGETGGVALLLTPALTVCAVYMYGRSRPPSLVSPKGGTRMGALLGLWMGALAAVITGVAGFVLRYGYHSHEMGDKIEQAAALMPNQLRTTGPPPPELLAFLQTPEFRAGTFIFGHVFTLLLLIAAGAVCGWMSATMLRARRQRSID